MKVTKELILKYFPAKRPYRFIDAILDVDAKKIIATYTFRKSEFFFKGHFPGNPVVPGAILQEAAAQIGLLAFGMYLLGNEIETLSDLPIELPKDIQLIDFEKLPIIKNQELHHLFYLTSADMDYKNIVRPEEKITVKAEKIFFRMNKLKCSVSIENEKQQPVSRGILSGMVVKTK